MRVDSAALAAVQTLADAFQPPCAGRSLGCTGVRSGLLVEARHGTEKKKPSNDERSRDEVLAPYDRGVTFCCCRRNRKLVAALPARRLFCKMRWRSSSRNADWSAKWAVSICSSGVLWLGDPVEANSPPVCKPPASPTLLPRYHSRNEGYSSSISSKCMILIMARSRWRVRAGAINCTANG
jgi:hypothetical protein